jgi:hypothetical protein
MRLFDTQRVLERDLVSIDPDSLGLGRRNHTSWLHLRVTEVNGGHGRGAKRCLKDYWLSTISEVQRVALEARVEEVLPDLQ